MSYGPGHFHRMGHTYCDCGWSGATKSALFDHLEKHEGTEDARAKLRREFESMVAQAIKEGQPARTGAPWLGVVTVSLGAVGQATSRLFRARR
jgi:hypothetical protein